MMKGIWDYRISEEYKSYEYLKWDYCRSQYLLANTNRFITVQSFAIHYHHVSEINSLQSPTLDPPVDFPGGLLGHRSRQRKRAPLLGAACGQVILEVRGVALEVFLRVLAHGSVRITVAVGNGAMPLVRAWGMAVLGVVIDIDRPLCSLIGNLY